MHYCIPSSKFLVLGFTSKTSFLNMPIMLVHCFNCWLTYFKYYNTHHGRVERIPKVSWSLAKAVKTEFRDLASFSCSEWLEEKVTFTFIQSWKVKVIQSYNTNLGYQNQEAEVDKNLGALKCLNALKWWTGNKMDYKWHYKFPLRKNAFD